MLSCKGGFMHLAKAQVSKILCRKIEPGAAWIWLHAPLACYCRWLVVFYACLVVCTILYTSELSYVVVYKLPNYFFIEWLEYTLTVDVILVRQLINESSDLSVPIVRNHRRWIGITDYTGITSPMMWMLPIKWNCTFQL